MTLPMTGAGASGAGSIALLLDAIPAKFAISTRKLRTAYAGQCLRLRRSSDNAESDFGFIGSPPELDTAAIATWLGVASGFTVTWYDQSGSGNNAVQAVAAAQALYVASGQNSKPVPRFDGINDLFTLSGPIFGAAGLPSSTFAACKPTVNITGFRGVWVHQDNVNAFLTDNGGYRDFSFISDINAAGNSLGSDGAAFLNTTTKLLYLTYDGGNRALASSYTSYLNASSFAVAGSGAAGGADTSKIGQDAAALGYFPGDIFEFVVFDSVLSAGNRATLETNINNYWAIY